MIKNTYISILFLSIALSVNWVWAGETQPSVPKLTVDYVANEGVLIRSGDKSVIIDGVFSKEYEQYDVLTDAEFLAMKRFDIDVALATHIHGDHYGKERMLAFLKKRKTTPLISNPQVIATLKDDVPEHLLLTKELTGFEKHKVTSKGVEFTLINLPHGSGRFKDIRNYAYLVDINGWRVLHVGDAAMNVEQFNGVNLAEMDIDVAILPYWYPFSKNGGQILELVSANRLIFAHVPPADVPRIEGGLQQALPKSHLLHKQASRVIVDQH